MDYTEKWEIDGKPLGEGGQGKVYRVILRSILPAKYRIAQTIKDLADRNLHVTERKIELTDQLLDELTLALAKEDPANLKALKVLQLPEDATNPEDAEERLKREIEAMQSISHKHLLNIVESDPEHKWYVMDYYQRGDLSKIAGAYAGDFRRSLRVFRPLVEGVAELHKRGFVHRDIKPQNVFVRATDDLVLGDFGLVIDLDNTRTRLTGTVENVGTRHWMPPWAEGRRIEDLSPNFDVYSLGKLLWWMVSGNRELLLREYFEQPRFNVEQLHPDAEYMDVANDLFRKCIVENEEDCLPDALALLQEVDRLLAFIASRVEGTTCSFCGLGVYEPTSSSSEEETTGLRSFSCSNCGNVQQFSATPEPENVFRPLIFVPYYDPEVIALGDQVKAIFRFTNPNDEEVRWRAFRFDEHRKVNFETPKIVPPLGIDTYGFNPPKKYFEGATEPGKHESKITITYKIGDDNELHEVTGTAQLEVQ